MLSIEQLRAETHAYFPHLSDEQLAQLGELCQVITFWNERINVISRKDIQNIVSRHVLHSLAIAHFAPWPSNSAIIDIGTGGGFPGLPLAIMYPDSQFSLLDSRQKKMHVVQEAVTALKLTNVQTYIERSEVHRQQYNFVTGRAVAAVDQFYQQTKHLILHKSSPTLTNGILYLTGEISPAEQRQLPPHTVYPLEEFFADPHYIGKILVYLEHPSARGR
jgi:16S rRNA (guanine527-N7)-methyltransferase